MLFNSCVKGALLHASQFWALKREDVQRLLRNERAMLRWMCKVEAEDDVSLVWIMKMMHDLYSRLRLQSLESRLRVNRLRWYRYVERSEDWIKRCTQIDVSGCQGSGRLHKSWKKSVTADLRLWNVSPKIVNDRSKWENALKTAMKSPTRGNRGKVAQSG